MPDGFDIAQRGGIRGGFPRGGFPRGGFPGRFPMRRFPRRFPVRFRRFPRFFFPIFFPQERCFFIDQFGRCCDRFGNCGFFDDFDSDGFPFAGSGDSIAAWSPSESWDRIEDPGMDEDYYDKY